MNEEAMSREAWLDYLSRLNQRRIQGRTASGVTSWALVGALAYLFTLLWPATSGFLRSSETFYQHTLAFTSLLNALITAAWLVIIVRYTLHKPRTPRILPSSRMKTSSILNFAFFSIFSFLAILNFVSAKYVSTLDIPSWAYWVFFVLFAILFVASIFSTNKGLPEIDIPPHLSGIWGRIFVVVFISLPIVFQIISIYFIIPSVTINHIDTLKWAIEAVVFFCLFFLIILKLAAATSDAYLDQLERDIILNNLSPEEIRARFIKDFLGEKLPDWFSSRLVRMEELRLECEGAFNAATLQMNEVTKIDPSMKHEIKGRKKEACDLCKSKVAAYLDYAKDFVSEIRHLARQQAFINDRSMVLEFCERFEGDSKIIESRYSSLCSVCQRRPENNNLSLEKAEESKTLAVNSLERLSQIN